MAKFLITYNTMMNATVEVDAENLREAMEILQEDIDILVDQSYNVTYEDIIAEDVEEI